MKRLLAVFSPRRLDGMILLGAGLLLAFATLALGGTPAWARAATQLGVLVLLGLWLLSGVIGGELNFRLPAVFYPMLAIFLFACLQAFARLSVYPPATRQEVWELLGAGGFFFLLHNQLTSVRRLERFVTALLWFAFGVAIFGVLQQLSFNGKIYWVVGLPQGGSPFGPFINRNHFAAWTLMLIPLAWGKLARRQRQREAQVFWALVFLALGVSVLLSLSRAGAILLALCFPLRWWLGRGFRASSRWALVVALVVILLAGVATLALDTGPVLARWKTLGELFRQPEAVDAYRWQIWRDTLRMIADRPWLGSGLETFGVLSDSYRSFPSEQQWLQAHNDYLQWVAETGVVGAGLALWFLVVLGRTAAEKLRLAEQEPARQLVVGALTGCVLVLLHSLVDFPLRIPANALLFMTLLAVITTPAAGPLLGPDPRQEDKPVGHAEFRAV